MSIGEPDGCICGRTITGSARCPVHNPIGHDCSCSFHQTIGEYKCSKCGATMSLTPDNIKNHLCNLEIPKELKEMPQELIDAIRKKQADDKCKCGKDKHVVIDSTFYYHPECFGLETLGELDTNEGYHFDLLVLFKEKDTGKLFIGRDSGCSCPAPFEDQTISDLQELTELQVPGIIDEVTEHYAYLPPLLRAEFIDKVRNLFRRKYD